MTWVMVDIESDGPCPGLFSMVCFGAVVVEQGLTRTFYGETAPITPNYDPVALSISGFSREQHEKFPNPTETMKLFDDWLRSLGKDKLMFISDNNGFDWQFINYYMHAYVGSNIFGFSSTNLGSLYKGIVRDTRKNFKHLRVTRHTHNPVDDAKGNAESFLEIQKRWLK